MEEFRVLVDAEVDSKGYVEDELRTTLFRKLRSKQDNRICFDCSGRNPTWVSLSYGIYLCLECSGDHRRFGVHVSFIRSCELDRFTGQQICQMACGGNSKAREFFKGHGVTEKRKDSTAGNKVNYFDKVAAKYRQLMEKETLQYMTELGMKPLGTQAEQQAAKPASQPLSDTNSRKPIVLSDTSATVQSTSPKQLVLSPKNITKPISVPIQVNGTAVPDANRLSVQMPNSDTGRASVGSAPPLPKTSKSKEIDFDFDFDELEKEANAPGPNPYSAPIKNAPVKSTTKQMASAHRDSGRDSGFYTSTGGQFATKKGISSDDIWPEQDTAEMRRLKTEKMESFRNSQAISSDAFFGNGDPQSYQEENIEQLKMAANRASEKGSAMLANSYAKGKEWVSSYVQRASAYSNSIA